MHVHAKVPHEPNALDILTMKQGLVRGPVSALGVLRGKAALAIGCKPHPASAPAGSNWSSHGGDKITEVFGRRHSRLGSQGVEIRAGRPLPL